MKRNTFIRCAVWLCMLGVLIASTLVPIAGMTAAWTPSAAYRKSTYYENLEKIPATGDKAFDTLSAALSQIGYHEANSSAGYGGQTTGSGNYTEYNFALGKIGGSYGYAWCAAFVSWCLVQADAAQSAAGLFASCTLWVDALRASGQYRTRSSGYTPKPGDLIFFRSAGVSRASDHVGLVRYVEGGRVYTVEGNSSDQVSLRRYALTDTYIVGYGLPSYGGVSLHIDRVKAEDVAAGIYAVTYDFLNVRASASATAAKQGTLQEGEVVSVRAVSNGWGEIEYQGKKAYISLEYADFIAPFSHKVRYVSEGTELLVLTHYSSDSPLVSTLTPERTGYTFLYWQDDSGRTYTASDKLGTGDKTLVAVYEELPAIEEPTPPVQEVPPGDEPLPPVQDGEGGGDADSQQPPSGEVPDAPLQGSADTAAARHAGVVSGLVAAVLGGIHFLLPRKREDE